ncbi:MULTISPECIES: class A beta-lactamase-related serine hydrolase [unclassified Streptomyces]|uniref:class A beta-lactamase-related serine hydrolase n=1 Tax=unclassified Streptomyces TaxID=2593676 RepID=UPI00215653EB|nr:MULTISPECIES: class A beta-lactamase-related serine hydrolase [unclassified Streptomyces]
MTNAPEQTEPREPRPAAGSDARLAVAVAPLVEESGARLSVTVAELELPARSATFGQDRYDTASIVKVDLLAALLLRAQDENRELTGAERDHAHAMITTSANDPATALWRRLGRGEALDEANRRLGLTATTSDPDGHWGLTQTTSADQVTLLRAVYGEDSPLTPDSRARVDELLRQVVPDQRWGVSAAADGPFTLKNGWLPRTRTGLWDINSIGRISAAGGDHLIAVVSDGHATFQSGVELVEAVSVAAVGALRD